MSTNTEKVAEKLPSKEELKEDVKKATKSSVQSLRALVAGGVGGVFAVVVGHPFDLVKVRMQTAEKGVYTGAMDVLRKGIARDGLVRGLYAGVSAPLVGVTPMCKCPTAPSALSKIFADLKQLPFPSGVTILANSSLLPFRQSRTVNSASPRSLPPVSSVRFLRRSSPHLLSA